MKQQSDLMKKILEAYNKISEASRNGVGNYMIVSPKFYEIFKINERQQIRKEKIKNLFN